MKRREEILSRIAVLEKEMARFRAPVALLKLGSDVHGFTSAEWRMFDEAVQEHEELMNELFSR